MIAVATTAAPTSPSTAAQTWSPQDNQPTAQFYRVSTDNAFPLPPAGRSAGQLAPCGSAIARPVGSAIGERDWEPTAGGESGHIVADPDDPDIVYGGSYGGYLMRVNHRTGERRAVNVWPDNPMGWGAAELTLPIPVELPDLLLAPRSGRALRGGQRAVPQPTNEGQAGRRSARDLTRNDKTHAWARPAVRSPRTTPASSTTAPSSPRPSRPSRPGVLWAGSRRRPDPRLARRRRELDRRDAQGAARMDADQLHRGASVRGRRPLRRRRRGTSSTISAPTSIGPPTTARPGSGSTAASSRITSPGSCGPIPTRAACSTPAPSAGVYVSFDDGASWRSLQLNLPIVPITDLAVKEAT